jgi:hypothetical protein
VELDKQVVEFLGRQRLMCELLRDGLEVAEPVRDRGVDLIAYADLSRQVVRFSSRPIQMKASSTCAFGVDQKYERIADLILAYVWYLDNSQPAVTYACIYAEAVRIAGEMGWTETASWQQGSYTSTRPSKRLLKLMEPYRMLPGRWWRLIVDSEIIAKP